ncbi:RNase H family protein [Micromonospora sp. NPDC050417]|uniref:RNase H family protein n=1 Tax=Micromonospora sp. NPDC050417 TaxID=3364280 RepID=UPI0037BAB312
MSQVVTGVVRAPAGLPSVIATDGSASKRAVRKVGYLTGFGWLSSTGGWGVGYCPQPTAIAGVDRAAVAELRAVSHAITTLLPAGPVTVLLDSQSAISYLNDWARGHLRMPEGYLGSAWRVPMLTRLAELVAAHPTNLRVRWVRGHAGHVLNECADSLALLGRRWLADHLDEDAVRVRGAWLAAGFLADHRLPDLLREVGHG